MTDEEIEKLEALSQKAWPKMQVSEMQTYLGDLFVKFSGELPGKVMGFLTDENDDAFRKVLLEIPSLLAEVRAGRKLREAVEGIDVALELDGNGEKVADGFVGWLKTPQATDAEWRTLRDQALAAYDEAVKII